MIKFSANLGFLWTDLPLIEAIYKAKKHGFDAVELQWPYDVNPIEVKNVLEEINLFVMYLKKFGTTKILQIKLNTKNYGN